MIGLRFPEVYNFFVISEQYNKFDVYTDNFDEFSFTELKDKRDKILSISHITPSHLQYEVTRPRISQAYKKLRSEKMSTDGYFIILRVYARSPFRDSESYLGIVAELDEDDIQLISNQKNSNFITYELAAAIYTSKDISEAV